jgi:hypothetical protein
MPSLVRCIDVGVFPVTGNETFGIGNIEMMASGVPVRCSRAVSNGIHAVVAVGGWFTALPCLSRIPSPLAGCARGPRGDPGLLHARQQRVRARGRPRRHGHRVGHAADERHTQGRGGGRGEEVCHDALQPRGPGKPHGGAAQVRLLLCTGVCGTEGAGWRGGRSVAQCTLGPRKQRWARY